VTGSKRPRSHRDRPGNGNNTSTDGRQLRPVRSRLLPLLGSRCHASAGGAALPWSIAGDHARKQPLPPCTCLVAVAGCHRRQAQRGGHEPITSAMKRPCSGITPHTKWWNPAVRLRYCTSGTPFASSSRVKVASVSCVEIRVSSGWPPRPAPSLLHLAG
jgi:hypothetical protein